MNAGKKSLALDLRSEKGKEIIRELVKVSDVFIQNFRVGLIDRIGFGYDVLKSLNPRIIMLNCSAYGQYGPNKDLIGWDTVGQAMSGHMSVTGYPEMPPVRTYFSLADRTTALHGTIGVLAALRQRSVTGRGQTIDVCLADSGYTWMEDTLIAYLAEGIAPERRGNRGRGAPMNIYKTKNGWVYVIASQKNQWERLCHLLSKPEWLEDPELQADDGRIRNIDMLDAEIERWTGQYTSQEVEQLMGQAEITCSAVSDVPTAAQNPQLWGRELLVEVEHPYDGGKVHAPGMAIKLGKSEPVIGPLSAPGQHNEEILMGLLKYTRDGLDRMKEEGVI
jgi:crotonobetainyl-CoA:carnitine CoA-transferase CaiB-like acyl-CoA transferase